MALTGCGGDNDNGSELPEVESMPTCSVDNFPQELANTINQAFESDFPMVPGMVVAVHRPEFGYAVNAFGVSNTSEQSSMPTDGLFDIGSVHKLFKWVMLERLQERGAISLNDDLSSWVDRPSIPGAKLNNLANHSTGMVDIDDSVYNDIWTNTSGGAQALQFSYEDMMDYLAAEGSEDDASGNLDGISNGLYTAFTLGSDYNYSSYGPVVAGEIARQATTMDPINLIRNDILDELELNNTSFHGYDPMPNAPVLGYGNDYQNPPAINEEHPAPNQNLMLATSSAVTGAMFSTGCDLLRFTHAISDPNAGYLTTDTIASRTNTSLNFANYLNAGRGVMQYYSQYDAPYWGHAGDGAHGHSSFVAYHRESGTSLVVLTNLNPYFMNSEYGDSYALHFAVTNIVDNFF